MKPRRELTGRSNRDDRRSRYPALGRDRIRVASFQRRPSIRSGRVLVAIDFSSPSLHALDYAVERAQEGGTAIILLHVLQPLYALGRLDASTLRSLKAEARRDVKRRLNTLSARRIGNKVPFKPWLLEGDPAEVIVAAAAKAGCDLIVVGSAGRTGMRRLLLGSVAERVVRAADIPVTVVRKPRKRKRPILRRIGFTKTA